MEPTNYQEYANTYFNLEACPEVVVQGCRKKKTISKGKFKDQLAENINLYQIKSNFYKSPNYQELTSKEKLRLLINQKKCN